LVKWSLGSKVKTSLKPLSSGRLMYLGAGVGVVLGWGGGAGDVFRGMVVVVMCGD
jgi:hypothetical protein